MRVCSLSRLAGGTILLTLSALCGPGAAAQNALHTCEIGVEAGDSDGFTVSLYNAFTGERYWTSTVSDTDGSDDLVFDTGGSLGGGVASSTYLGRTTVVVPAVGLFVIEFSGGDFAAPIAYEWGDNVTTQAVGSFCRPVPRQESADTYFVPPR